MYIHRSLDLRWLAEVGFLGNKTCIRRPNETENEDSPLELVQTEVWKEGYVCIFETKRSAYGGILIRVVLHHNYYVSHWHSNV